MSRARRRRALAVPAFLLALLVPARAAALCCFDGHSDDRRSHPRAHGAPHDGDSRAETKRVLLPAAPASECETLAPAPALRERDRAADAPGAGGVPSTSPLAPGPSMIEAILPSLSPRSSTYRETPHPLRR